MIISDRVKNLLNKVLPLFENITFGDIIQRMQADIEAGGGGGGAFASQAEAEAGTDTTKYMNPLRTAEAIAALGGGGFTGLTEFVLENGTGNLDSVVCGTSPQTCIVFTGAAPVVEGISAGASGKRLILKKVGAGSLTIKQNGSATAADNIALNTGADVTILSGEAIELLYTSAGPFWVHVTSAINATSGGSGGNIVIFYPDIAATAGNRYKTWPEVMTALAGSPLLTELLIHKPGVFQVVAIPAGTYDLSKVFLSVTPGTTIPVLSFADGCDIVLPQRIHGLQIKNFNTSAPLAIAPAFSVMELLDSSFVNDSTATQPLLSVPTGTNLSLRIDGGLSPIFKDGGGVEPIFVEGTLSITLTRIPAASLFSTNDLFTNNVSGNGTLNITSQVLIPGGYVRNDTNYDGVVNIVQNSETRVQELIDAKFATEITDEIAWRKRTGVFIAPAASDYLTLGYKPGFSPTVDYIPAGESWDFEVIVFAYYMGAPNAVPVYVSKTFKYTMIHDATTGTIVATVTETGSNGSALIAVTAGGNGAAPQHPHIFVQNNDSHSIAVEHKWTRMKNQFPVSNS